jgi:uncharacterized protein YkwD
MIDETAWSPDDAACAALALVNAARVRAGRLPLVMDRVLGMAAEDHVEDMIRHDYYGHKFADGTTFGQRLTALGYPTAYRAEVLMAGSADPAYVVAAWLRSPTHGPALRSGRYKAIGLARDYGAGTRHGWYWAGVLGGRIVDPVACEEATP